MWAHQNIEIKQTKRMKQKLKFATMGFFYFNFIEQFAKDERNQMKKTIISFDVGSLTAININIVSLPCQIIFSLVKVCFSCKNSEAVAVIVQAT